jgi:hypothetical protein
LALTDSEKVDYIASPEHRLDEN